jgi:hypothetical protein
MPVYPKIKRSKTSYGFDGKVRRERLIGLAVWTKAKDAMGEEAAAVNEFLTTGYSPYLPSHHPKHRQRTPSVSGLDAFPRVRNLSGVCWIRSFRISLPRVEFS